MPDGRELDLELELLDRQVVDRAGRLVCKVDDLELDMDESGRLFVTTILVGPRALAPRFGGRLGRWMDAIARRLDADHNRGPDRIDFAKVTDIGSAITIAADRDELGVNPLEDWVERYVISRIPGARHAGK